MSHPHHDLFENRRQFQLERMILFSDAVFAIAITLLVIELKVPEMEQGESVGHALIRSNFIFGILGLLLSFGVIGQFWTNHHRLFGYVTNYDGSLLWLNLHMLFWIVLMPFSSALNSRYGNNDMVWMIYSFNMFMIGISIYFLWRYITNPKRNLSEIAHNEGQRRMARARSFLISCIFLSGALLALLPKPYSWSARMVFGLIFPVISILKRRYAQKNNPAH
ncbi:MAG: DUF1211 domain-containing protein [Chitinophagaceae bacterium]|nr:DUF1211 domain-containing protein [Chitinophagaceae bacterium]